MDLGDRNQDELNANDLNNDDDSRNHKVKASESEATDYRPTTTETPKENPFSFKHFLRRETTSSSALSSQSNTNVANGHHQHLDNASTSTQSPSKSATTSSLSSTGARPKIPQFQSVNVIHNQADSKMKRSPKFSSFDSQSSLSELSDRNMHSSRSNNSFNIDYQFPSSRSYSNNYDVEPSSPSIIDRKQIGGARCFAQRSQSNANNSSSTILPDFVQDHLLMEYYGPSANMSNMPLSGDDFYMGNSESMNHQNGNNSQDPFDLNFNRSPSTRRRANQPTMPLDLPSLDLSSHRSNSSNYLPPDLMDNPLGGGSVQREETYGPHNEPEITRDQAAIDSKMQTLPDFLSDGPIHSSGRLADVATISHDGENQSIVRLQQENDRLRMIISDMENQITQAKNLETQYNVTLAESMEQVEENLFASNQRATEALSQANKYKQQVKQLTTDIQNMRRENEALREGGAVGGIGMPENNSNHRHLAKDLRLAAASAENNLRQLLSGVENLRLIANTMENLDQPNYLSDSDENDFNEGPAL